MYNTLMIHVYLVLIFITINIAFRDKKNAAKMRLYPAKSVVAGAIYIVTLHTTLIIN